MMVRKRHIDDETETLQYLSMTVDEALTSSNTTEMEMINCDTVTLPTLVSGPTLAKCDIANVWIMIGIGGKRNIRSIQNRGSIHF